MAATPSVGGNPFKDTWLSPTECVANLGSIAFSPPTEIRSMPGSTAVKLSSISPQYPMFLFVTGRVKFSPTIFFDKEKPIDVRDIRDNNPYSNTNLCKMELIPDAFILPANEVVRNSGIDISTIPIPQGTLPTEEAMKIIHQCCAERIAPLSCPIPKSSAKCDLGAFYSLSGAPSPITKEFLLAAPEKFVPWMKAKLGQPLTIDMKVFVEGTGSPVVKSGEDPSGAPVKIWNPVPNTTGFQQVRLPAGCYTSIEKTNDWLRAHIPHSTQLSVLFVFDKYQYHQTYKHITPCLRANTIYVHPNSSAPPRDPFMPTNTPSASSSLVLSPTQPLSQQSPSSYSNGDNDSYEITGISDELLLAAAEAEAARAQTCQQ